MILRFIFLIADIIASKILRWHTPRIYIYRDNIENKKISEKNLKKQINQFHISFI